MQSLAKSGYAEAQVITALHSANRQIAFRYDLLDSSNNYKKALTTVTSASVANNSLAEIKRTARFTLRDDAAINYLSDRIKPWVRLKMLDGGWAEWPQGVFLLSTPPRKADDTGVYREIEAYDMLQVLTDDRIEYRYTVAAGENYITAVGAVLTGAGITDQNLTPTALTLPTDRDWEPSTTKLQIVNDLLSAINYYSLEFNEHGQAIAKPYVSPDARASEYTYKNDSTSVIFPGVEQNIDLFAIPNKWVLVMSEPDAAALTGTYTNTNPSSPTSTVSRGRTIVSYVENVEAADQTTITALALRAAYEASQVYEAVQFETAIMPFHSNADSLTLEYTRLGIAAKFNEVSWAFDFTPGAQMQHRIRRVVTI
jgi:hypothetical protein